MTSTLLIYPFFRRTLDRSRFRFPPLGIAYVAASLREAGHDVSLLDCTFLSREEAVSAARAAGAEVVGIYCMATMLDDALGFAGALRGATRLLVAGGPLPTCDPGAFRERFDVVVRGEGEQTMVELLAAHEAGGDLGAVPGVVLGRVDGAAHRGRASGGGAGGGERAAAAQRAPIAPAATSSPAPSHASSSPTSTRFPSRPATCSRTRSTSASGGASTAPRSRPS